MCAIITTINNFLADFSSGRLDESSTHWVLIGVIAAAEISLGVGIWIESPKNKTKREWTGVGFVLFGCIISALFTVLLLLFDEGISRAQQRDIAEARLQLAKAGLTIGTLSGNLDEMRERLTQAEKGIKDLQAGHAPAPPVPPTIPTGTYSLTREAALIIRDTTLPGAVVSIVPFMPSLEPFASALGEAFAAVSGVQVAVGRGNFIANGQTGLIVQYDHANAVSASVFNALVKAGLNPIEGPATPGTSIVFIKVAPKP